MNRVLLLFATRFALSALAIHFPADRTDASLLAEINNLGVNQNNVSRIVVHGRVEPFPWFIEAEVNEVDENNAIWLELSGQERYEVWERSAWRSIDFYVVGDEITPTATVDVNATGEAHIRGQSPRSGGYASPGLLKWIVGHLEASLDRIGNLRLQRKDGTTFLEGALISLDSITRADRDRDRSNAVLLPSTIGPQWHPVFRDAHYRGYLDASVIRADEEYKVNLILRHDEHIVYMDGARDGNHVNGMWREWAGYCLTSRDVDKGIFELVLLHDQ